MIVQSKHGYITIKCFEFIDDAELEQFDLFFFKDGKIIAVLFEPEEATDDKE